MSLTRPAAGGALCKAGCFFQQSEDGGDKEQSDKRAGDVDAHIPERRAPAEREALMEFIQPRVDKAEAPCADARTGEEPEPERQKERDSEGGIFRHMSQLAHERMIDAGGGDKLRFGQLQRKEPVDGIYQLFCDRIAQFAGKGGVLA